ncbi:MAG: RDD family protein [Acidobacteriota bacterium]
MSLDTRQERETPEGVTLTFPVAGPPIRMMAWLFDTFIVLLCQTVIGVIVALLGTVGTGLYLLVAFLLTWFYSVYFEVFRDGSTPGKSRMGLQVVMDDGTPVTPMASVLRNLLRTADFLPFANAAGLITMSVDRDFRRLGDLAAGTLVIHRRHHAEADPVPPENPVVPPVALTSEERRRLVDYASRLPRWNAARAQELAGYLYPLTGVTGVPAVRRLVGIANWTLGRAELPAPPPRVAPAAPADRLPPEAAAAAGEPPTATGAPEVSA